MHPLLFLVLRKTGEGAGEQITEEAAVHQGAIVELAVRISAIKRCILRGWVGLKGGVGEQIFKRGDVFWCGCL